MDPNDSLLQECADGDHDWQHEQDWEGDPGVINGTNDFCIVTCRTCGKDGECYGDHSSSYDEDDFR